MQGKVISITGRHVKGNMWKGEIFSIKIPQNFNTRRSLMEKLYSCSEKGKRFDKKLTIKLSITLETLESTRKMMITGTKVITIHPPIVL